MTNEKGYHLALRNYALSLAKINEELDHRELIEPHMHATQILAMLSISLKISRKDSLRWTI